MTPCNPCELGMPTVAANVQALSQLTFLGRAGTACPERAALINGPLRQTWGAHLSAPSNMIRWELGRFPAYLWALPMFHCNGWCFPRALAAVAMPHAKWGETPCAFVTLRDTCIRPPDGDLGSELPGGSGGGWFGACTHCSLSPTGRGLG